jgi:hypothetical protein
MPGEGGSTRVKPSNERGDMSGSRRRLHPPLAAGRRRIALHCIVALAAALATTATLAAANNTHTSYSIHYHGIGDGTDSDNYTHPFINENDGVSGLLRIDVYSFGSRQYGSAVYGRHHHFNDRRLLECATWAREGVDNRRTPLGYHYNFHHSRCY